MSVMNTVAASIPGTSTESSSDEAPSRLGRYRMVLDRPGLKLRAGELVLCAEYEYAPHQAVMPVRCEADGYAPGALLAREEVEFLERTTEVLSLVSWGKPGARI